jgi:hypothetical protein
MYGQSLTLSAVRLGVKQTKLWLARSPEWGCGASLGDAGRWKPRFRTLHGPKA